MPQTPLRPAALNLVSGRMMQQDLLTPTSPYTPVTPSSTTAARPGSAFQLSAPPTPTFSSAGTGVLVKLSDGSFAVKTIRKTLRIDEKEGSKEKGIEWTQGMEVDFRTDGIRAFEIRKASL